MVRELRRSDFMFATSTECVESKGVFATNIRTIMSSSYLACHGRAAQCYDKREAKAISGETLCRNKGSSCQRPSSETQADIFFLPRTAPFCSSFALPPALSTLKLRSHSWTIVSVLCLVERLCSFSITTLCFQSPFTRAHKPLQAGQQVCSKEARAFREILGYLLLNS